MQMIEYADREALIEKITDHLARDLTLALQNRPRATFVVPGGTTPGPIFALLCRKDLDWAQVDVLLSDARWLPEDDPRSNTRLLRQRLLVNRAAAAGYLPLYAACEFPEQGLPALAAGLEPHLPIAVMLLGMGTDMHTASLFPGADKLTQGLAPDAPALVAMRAPGAPEARITLSARVLDASEHKHIVILGDDKRVALEHAQTLTPSVAPVCAVLNDTTVHWAP